MFIETILAPTLISAIPIQNLPRAWILSATHFAMVTIKFQFPFTKATVLDILQLDIALIVSLVFLVIQAIACIGFWYSSFKFIFGVSDFFK